MLFFVKILYYFGFSPSTQWAWCAHSPTRPSVSQWDHFLSFFCGRKEKRKRALLEHMATSKQHHYVFDKKIKKNPHSNILGVFFGKDDVLHFNSTAGNAKMSFNASHHRGGILSLRPDKERSQVYFNWICPYKEMHWTVCGSVFQWPYLWGEELAASLFGCQFWSLIRPVKGAFIGVSSQYWWVSMECK